MCPCTSATTSALGAETSLEARKLRHDELLRNPKEKIFLIKGNIGYAIYSSGVLPKKNLPC